MMIAGITRARNSAQYIRHTLDHVASLVDAIYVYDDCSDDHTAQICINHPKVKKVLEGDRWMRGPVERNKAEGDLRQAIYEEALKDKPDWVYYFDADEFAYFEGIDFHINTNAYRLRLFDFYVTEEDKNKHFLKRKWMGPEYRDILMLFRPLPGIRFYQREPRGISDHIQTAGYVKHYGKAISVEEWERKCDYYIKERGAEEGRLKMFRDKWKDRKGKAVHTVSDFGRELIRWGDRYTRGVVLTD